MYIENFLTLNQISAGYGVISRFGAVLIGIINRKEKERNIGGKSFKKNLFIACSISRYLLSMFKTWKAFSVKLYFYIKKKIVENS